MQDEGGSTNRQANPTSQGAMQMVIIGIGIIVTVANKQQTTRKARSRPVHNKYIGYLVSQHHPTSTTTVNQPTKHSHAHTHTRPPTHALIYTHTRSHTFGEKESRKEDAEKG